MLRPKSSRGSRISGGCGFPPISSCATSSTRKSPTCIAIANIPDDPDLAIQAGSHLCGTLLDPLQDTFGRLAIRSAYRSPEVNAFGNEHALSCASNAASAAGHIWDRRDENGHMGAMACIVVPWFADRFRAEGDWRRMAWWIHDHLPYSRMTFFPKLWAFNLSWHERPERRIDSYARPLGCLTKVGMANHERDHSADYDGFPCVRSLDKGLCRADDHSADLAL